MIGMVAKNGDLQPRATAGFFLSQVPPVRVCLNCAESDSSLIFLFEHDLFREQVSTSRDHPLAIS